MRNITSELGEIQDDYKVRDLMEDLDKHTIRLNNRLTRQRKDRVTDLLLELQAVIEETTSEVFQNLEEVEAAYEWLSGEICYEKYLIATDYEENFASPKSYWEHQQKLEEETGQTITRTSTNTTFPSRSVNRQTTPRSNNK